MSLTAFMHPDESIILMEGGLSPKLSDADLDRFYAAGVRTMWQYVTWRDVEPEQDCFVFDCIDPEITRLREHGYKVLVVLHADYTPAWIPDDWCLRDQEDKVYEDWRCQRPISPWCSAAYHDELYYLRKTYEHLSFQDVLCARGTLSGGETMLTDDRPAYFDRYAQRDFKNFFGSKAVPTYPADLDTTAWLQRRCLDMMLTEQNLFVPYKTEYWTMLHHAFDAKPWTGNQFSDSIYDDLTAHYPCCDHESICYGLFAGQMGLEATLRDIRQRQHRVWVGSEFCQGLNANTQTAIRLGFRGFVTSPIHAWSGYKTTEDWMFTAVAASIAQWRLASELHQA
jgi:hypothetical protein